MKKTPTNKFVFDLKTFKNLMASEDLAVFRWVSHHARVTPSCYALSDIRLEILIHTQDRSTFTEAAVIPGRSGGEYIVSSMGMVRIVEGPGTGSVIPVDRVDTSSSFVPAEHVGTSEVSFDSPDALKAQCCAMAATPQLPVSDIAPLPLFRLVQETSRIRPRVSEAIISVIGPYSEDFTDRFIAKLGILGAKQPNGSYLVPSEYLCSGGMQVVADDRVTREASLTALYMMPATMFLKRSAELGWIIPEKVLRSHDGSK